MNIKIFDKALETLTKQVSLKNSSIKKDDISASYIVHIEEAFIDTQYFYIRLNNGRQALYSYPSLKLLVGESIINKKQIKSIPKKEYKNQEEVSDNERTDRLFRSLLQHYKSFEEDIALDSKYQSGISYLISLYSNPNPNTLSDYETLYNRLKRECDNLGLIYETDPTKILNRRIKEAQEKQRFSYLDITKCTSKEALDEYFNTNILSCTDSRKMLDEIKTLEYMRTFFVLSYNGEFLSYSSKLLNALETQDYPNREEILKNYLEFFITKDIAFFLVRYMDSLIKEGHSLQIKLDGERHNKNTEFMEDLVKIVTHNPAEETYWYHATTSENSANKILNEGFYLYAEDLDQTSYPELSINDILAYSYGNGFETYGDYIIVISDKKEEEIVRKLTPEEQEQVEICPRRDALIGIKPDYKVEKNHIVGIIDKKHERIIFNEEYQNTSKKQI